MCGKEMTTENIQANVSIGIINYCDKCEQRHEDLIKLYFCCIDCLIEFTNKKMTWQILRLRDKK
jgi:hypothetical protein